MSEATEFLELLATQAQVGEQIDAKKWGEFMGQVGYPLTSGRYRVDQLESARKTWFQAYKIWLKRQEQDSGK